ncbi:septum formation protein Maf [Acetobacterium tundrae]|uniref:dTTP/UTP pyrophosphatase n=1 Tax=Acetobacterium tundrae TaxID=132932 RepID=A0ABR6WLV6_9FIRM|nr:septum formation protein Maf [Acetobacterium tundrae]
MIRRQNLNPKIILASQSPRRRELLELAVKDFEIKVADIDEKKIEMDILKNQDGDFLAAAKKLVLELSLRKAQEIQKDNQEALVIGADTVVVLNDQILGKPMDEDDAYRMIKILSGNTHRVLTGVSIKFGNLEEQFVSVSKIKFFSWNKQMKREVRAYVASGKAMDKAGAYGIQEEAGLWVKWIKGDYNNIVGLPIAQLNKRLNKLMNKKVN